MSSLRKEQEICKNCGFCCDGTLFPWSRIYANEKEVLPKQILSVYYSKKGEERFKQPCPAFHKICTIYQGKKARICSEYRCQLLNDFSEKKLDFNKSLAIIEHAKKLKEDILKEYIKITSEKNIEFWEIARLDKMESRFKTLKVKSKKLISSLAVFNLLLIKHFRSNHEFKEMV